MSANVNMIIQYIVVSTLLLCAIAWTIRRFIRLKKQDKPSSCHGCAIADACSRKDKSKVKPNDNICPK